MRTILVVALIIAVASCNLVQQDFESFLTKYGKTYVGAEYERRLAIFEENSRIVAEHQRLNPSAVYGVTKFFDMPYAEWKATILMEQVHAAALAPNCLKHGIYRPDLSSFKLPTSWDWRDHEGVVTKVKDQASCGSCWAFSTAANIEGVLGVAGKSVGDLSPQHVVDCSKACTSEMYNGANTTVCNGGCNGGWPWAAYFDIDGESGSTMGGIASWNDYPYTGYAGTCQTKPVATKISGYTCITTEDGLDEVTMAQALVTYGPLSIAINANYFYGYKSGVMDIAGCPTAYLNHAILLVGYGHDDTLNKDYWIVKNSWATSWGEEGYVRVVRGTNMCGITEGVVTANL